MKTSMPWSRQQIVVLVSLTHTSKLYALLGEKAALHTHACTGALKDKATSLGARIYPTLSHQVLAVFSSPSKALDWVEQLPTSLLAMKAASDALATAPTAVVALDCADTNEIQGVLHSAALANLERLVWGRTDETVFLDNIIPVLPSAFKGRVTRITAPIELGPVWRLGPKQGSLVTSAMAATQPSNMTSSDAASGSSASMPAPSGPLLRLEMLDKKMTLNSQSKPLTVGRTVADGLSIPDARVSRVHARIEPRGDHFAVIDLSSNGTWIQFHNQATAIELRQSECILHTSGVLSFGAEPNDFSAPTIGFVLSNSTAPGPSGFNALGAEAAVTQPEPLAAQ